MLLQMVLVTSASSWFVQILVPPCYLIISILKYWWNFVLGTVSKVLNESFIKLSWVSHWSIIGIIVRAACSNILDASLSSIADLALFIFYHNKYLSSNLRFRVALDHHKMQHHDIIKKHVAIFVVPCEKLLLGYQFGETWSKRPWVDWDIIWERVLLQNRYSCASLLAGSTSGNNGFGGGS